MIKKPYIYKLSNDYTWNAKDCISQNIYFKNKWLKIEKGKITVSKNYAWNGCSPKISIADLISIGTPDGSLVEGYPITYHASLVHDALCQFDVPLEQEAITKIFDVMLAEKDFFWRKIYVWAVRWFGPKKGDVRKRNG